MEAKNKIIQQILLEAEADSQAVTANKQKLVEQALASSQQQIDKKYQEVVEKSKNVRAEILKNAQGSAQLEWKKYRLESKRALIDSCFDDANKKLCNLDTKDYLDIMAKLIKNYAKKGDRILIAQKDSKAITQDFLNKFDLDLKLEGFADISGGIKIVSKKYDIDLSIDMIVKSSKSNLEVEVSKILFGEE